MGTAALIGGGAAAGAAGGLIKGAKGTPDVTQISNANQTSQTKFGAPSTVEQGLQNSALSNYTQSGAGTTALEQSARNAQGFQNQSQQFAQDVLNGQNFNLTPQEQSQISALRQSLVDQGSSDVNKLLNERMNLINQDAGVRGLRGQALAELQGQSTRTGAEQLNNIILQANQQAAQQAMQMPYQRLGIQAQAANQGLSFADQLRQQAIQNRNIQANPALLQALRNERQAQGINSSSSSSTSTTPGQAGGFGNAIIGGLGGGLGGAKIGADVYESANNLKKKNTGSTGA